MHVLEYELINQSPMMFVFKSRYKLGKVYFIGFQSNSLLRKSESSLNSTAEEGKKGMILNGNLHCHFKSISQIFARHFMEGDMGMLLPLTVQYHCEFGSGIVP
nr:D-amino acid oxidase activator [Microcebus murinus]